MMAAPSFYASALFAIQAAIFLHLHRKDHEPFFLLWGVAWVLLSVRQAAAAAVGNPVLPWLWLDVAIVIAAAALLLLGGFAFAGPARLGPLRAGGIGLTLGVLTVLIFTALVRIGPLPHRTWAAAIALLSVAGMVSGWLVERYGRGEEPSAVRLAGVALAAWGAFQPVAWMLAGATRLAGTAADSAGWLLAIEAALGALLGAGVILLGLEATRSQLIQGRSAARLLVDPRDLFDEDPNMIIVLEDGRFVFANRAFRQRSGRSLEDVQGQALLEHIAPEHRHEAARHLAARFREEPTSDYELELIDALGHRVPVLIHADTILWDGEKAIRCELTDITTRRQTEAEIHAVNAELQRINAELEKSNQSKSEFLSNTSHELKTPLTSIIANTEILEYEMCGPVNPEQRRVLANIGRNSQHLLDMISRLLDFSRHEEGRPLLRYSRTDLGSLLESVVETVRPLVEDGARNITHFVDERLEPCFLDGEKIYRVYLNLVENAIKFSNDGEIRVEAQRMGEELEGRVMDQGIGIPPDKLEEVFEAFRQVDASSTRPYQGVGLGLAICKQLIELHGGRIWVESSPGKGSAFRFRVPYRIEPPPTAPATVLEKGW